MQLLEKLVIKKNQDLLIKILKIILIGFVSFSLLASAIPFYLGFDDILFGIGSINLANGDFEITNELFQQTGDKQFIPKSFITTNHNTAIPKSSVGIYSVGSIFYSIGGFFGLLYFGPIITILFLILFERISTKLFGNLVGLLALLMLVGDWHFHFIGLRLATHNIFSMFFILGIFSLLKFFHNNNDRYILLCSTFFVISTFFRINGIVAFPLEIITISGIFITKYVNKMNSIHNNKSLVFLVKRSFSKFQFKKFLKIFFYFIIPWLIFLAFWFSYNDYFFGDATTNYREQSRKDLDFEKQPSAPDLITSEEESEKFTENELARIQLVQYYLVPLIPDPMYFFLMVSSDTDLDIWRSDIWISFITFPVLLITLVFSLYFKIKRAEIFTIILFIAALVAFYSSPLTSDPPLAPNLSEHANSRYMIPASILSFSLFGFILVESWKKFFSKKPNQNKKFLKSLKIIFLFTVISFFLALIAVMPSVQDTYQTGLHFNNPLHSSKIYEEFEKLPDKSLIVGYDGGKTLLHTDTHFYPYGKKFIENQGISEFIPTAQTEKLKEILENGYTAYAFKNNIFFYDNQYFKILEADYDIILKDYSKTFCELQIISNNKESTSDINSDPICFEDVIDRREKIWNVTLKWN